MAIPLKFEKSAAKLLHVCRRRGVVVASRRSGSLALAREEVRRLAAIHARTLPLQQRSVASRPMSASWIYKDPHLLLMPYTAIRRAHPNISTASGSVIATDRVPQDKRKASRLCIKELGCDSRIAGKSGSRGGIVASIITWGAVKIHFLRICFSYNERPRSSAIS